MLKCPDCSADLKSVTKHHNNGVIVQSFSLNDKGEYEIDSDEIEDQYEIGYFCDECRAEITDENLLDSLNDLIP